MTCHCMDDSPGGQNRSSRRGLANFRRLAFWAPGKPEKQLSPAKSGTPGKAFISIWSRPLIATNSRIHCSTSIEQRNGARRSGRDQVLDDETLPACAHNRMTQQAIFIGDVEQRMDNPAAADEDFGRSHQTFRGRSRDRSVAGNAGARSLGH